MKIGVFSNVSCDKDRVVTNNLFEALKKNMIEFVEISDFKTIKKEFDFVCVLGGDGTILSATNACAEIDTPVLGINLGKIGFLSEIEISEIQMFIERIKKGDYEIDERTMLKVEYGGKSYTALNDIAIIRENSFSFHNKVIKIDAYIGGHVLANYVGDGVIVSTPTGSTAYSLSAGGSVLSPNVEATIITCICPHSLHTKPVVISDKEIITLMPKYEKSQPLLVCDGRNIGTMTAGGVVVKKHDKKAKFIKITDISFYTKLLKKLTKM